MSNQYLTFDVTKANQVQQLIVGRQGDNALKTVSMLFWDGEKNRPYDLTGKQVYFEALKPDNSHIVDYAGITITDPKYGLATYAFNEQVFTVQGMMQQAFFKISETNASGKVTTDSALEVSINVLSNSVEFGIKSEDYLSEYDRLIADVEQKFDDYANAVSGNIAEVSKAHNDIQALMKQISDNNIVTINEFNLTKDEVQLARTNTSGKTYPSLGDRINDEEASLINNMNTKISQISSVPETFANLSALRSTYPNGKTGLFVTADTGHKFIWANGSWNDAGFYQSVGIADSSINPQALLTTDVPLDKTKNDYPNTPFGDNIGFLFIPNEPLELSGNVNIRIKSKITEVKLYLLQKTDKDKYLVKDRITTNTTVDGWQTIKTNFYVTGSGDEFIGVIGNTYYVNTGEGKGVLQVAYPDPEASTFSITKDNTTFDLALYPTFENVKVVKKVEENADTISKISSHVESLENATNAFQNTLPTDVVNDKTGNTYPVTSNNTSLFVVNEPISKKGIINVSLDTEVTELSLYLLKKTSENNYAVKNKLTTNTVDGWQTIKTNFYATGDGDEFIGFIGKLRYKGATAGGVGLYEKQSADKNSQNFVTTKFLSGLDTSIYWSVTYLDQSKKAPETLITTEDFKLLKYTEISEPVGFVGRWFDTTVNGVPVKATINDGSELYFKVKNTTKINVNWVLNSALVTPQFAYSIDGSDMVRQAVTNPLLPAVSTDEHIIRIVADGMNEDENKWVGEKGMAFKDVTIDVGGTVTGIIPKNRKIMFYGDSITQGTRVLGTPSSSNTNSASHAYAFIASSLLNSVSYRVGFGGTGLTKGGGGGIPKISQFIDNMTQNRETPYYEPDVVVMNMGTNDKAATTETFSANLNVVLNRLTIKYSGTPIFIMIPFDQSRKQELTEAVATRKNMFLIETDGWNVTTTDGIHPDVAGSLVAGKKLAESIISVLGKSYFIE